MTGMIANLLVNILIVGLLGVTIGYCWALNRRIKILQDSKSELAQLLKHFDESTERASQSIIALQTASKKIGENIQMRIEKANYMIDDLTFMIEKGQRIAHQMEAGFAIHRAQSKVAPSEPEDAAPDTEITPPPMRERAQARGVSSKEKTTSTLGAVLERVAGRVKSPADDAAPDETAAPARGAKTPRSKSEQELLNLIKAGLKG